MALNSIFCADVPLRNYPLTHFSFRTFVEMTVVKVNNFVRKFLRKHPGYRVILALYPEPDCCQNWNVCS